MTQPCGIAAGGKQDLAAQDDSTQVENGLRDGTVGFDGFGIGLVVTLSDDQVNQLIRQLHVGIFQRTGLQSPQRSATRLSLIHI